MKYESLFVKFSNYQLHVMHIQAEANTSVKRMPVLMIHGMVENGRIFYHESGKGLGSYLAQQGYDVYVADLRGQGKSLPPISRRSQHGQTETIREDLPALIEFVCEQANAEKTHLIAHSWGGVYLNSTLAWRTDLIEKVCASVYFGSKRCVRAQNIDRLLKIDLIWNLASTQSARLVGYVPAKRLGIGSDNETLKTHAQCLAWVRPGPWVDTEDGFDYGESLRFHALPPTWYIAAINDHSLGHRDDVYAFMEESGAPASRYSVLSKQTGCATDYDHISMLTASGAIMDHFPRVVSWLHRYEK